MQFDSILRSTGAAIAGSEPGAGSVTPSIAARASSHASISYVTDSLLLLLPLLPALPLHLPTAAPCHRPRRA